MHEQVEIKWRLSIGYSGAEQSDSFLIDREEWESMNDEQQGKCVWEAIESSGVVDFDWDVSLPEGQSNDG
jgi:hypothetical protein